MIVPREQVTEGGLPDDGNERDSSQRADYLIERRSGIKEISPLDGKRFFTHDEVVRMIRDAAEY